MGLKTKILSFCVIAVLIGLAFSGGPLAYGILLVLLSLMAGFTMLVGVIDLLFRTAFFVYPGILLVGLGIATGVALGKHNLSEYLKQQRAEHIIQEIEQYEATHGTYPDSLAEVVEADRYDIAYTKAQVGQAFYLSFDIGAWESKTYTSQSEQWVMRE